MTVVARGNTLDTLTAVVRASFQSRKPLSILLPDTTTDLSSSSTSNQRYVLRVIASSSSEILHSIQATISS